jgi:hypothetical protein
MDQIAHLYKVTNLLTNEYYVGKHNGLEQSVKGKNKLYWGSGNRIINSIKKYGEENFRYDILCYGSSDYIYELEKKYITPEVLEEDKLCLNLTVGGDGPSYHKKETLEKISQKVRKHLENPESRKKLSESGKRYFAENPEARLRISQRKTGVKASEETRKKQSESMKKAYAKDPELRKKAGGKNKGKIPSEDHKQKISIANKGKVRSEEAKQKLREARAKQVFSDEVIEKRNKTLSTLVWMNDGTRNYRVKPETVASHKENGMVEGRVFNYIDDKYKEKHRKKALLQWEKVKASGKKLLKEK